MKKETKKLIRFLRDIQGIRQYKGKDKLSMAYRYERRIKQ
jgi:hypothetical protein